MTLKSRLLVLVLIFSSFYLRLAESHLCQICHCTEPHVDCFHRNLTTLQYSIPEDSDIVNLSRNHIEVVPCNLAWPLSVIDIDLSRNKITRLESCAFQQFTLLEALNLSHNMLEFINPNLFDNLTNLNSLDVSHNRLKIIDQWFLKETNNLMRLNLGHNPLGDIVWKEDTFSNMVWLKYLDLSNVSTGVLPLQIFSSNTKLIELRISKNPWDHVPITQLHSVKQSLELLDMTNTNLSMIRNHEFHKMEGLKILLLNNMENLESIEALAFHSLNLETLEIKNNPKLTYIDPLAFYDTLQYSSPNNVKNLDLSNNALVNVPFDLIVWNNSDQINLSGNPFHCDCSISWMINQSWVIGNEYLICSSPDELKDRTIQSLRLTELNCNDGLSKSYGHLYIISAAILAATFIVSIIISCCIVKSSETRLIKIAKRLTGARRNNDEPISLYMKLNN